MEHKTDDLTHLGQSVRFDIYLLLAMLLRQKPSAELMDFLTQLDIENNDTDMAKAWVELKNSASHAVDTDDEFQNLFIGIGRGEVVPFASWHLTGSLMEKPLAQLRQTLLTLGFERAEGVKEPEDHISAICEVMSYLCEQPEEQQKMFFNQHIGPWFSKLVEQIRQANHAKFYLSVANLMDTFLTIEQVKFTQAPEGAKTAIKIDVKNLTDSLQSH